MCAEREDNSTDEIEIEITAAMVAAGAEVIGGFYDRPAFPELLEDALKAVFAASPRGKKVSLQFR